MFYFLTAEFEVWNYGIRTEVVDNWKTFDSLDEAQKAFAESAARVYDGDLPHQKVVRRVRLEDKTGVVSEANIEL